MEKHDHAHGKSKDRAEDDRFYWQMPNRVMKEIGIREGMIVVDFGAGRGYFTGRIAKRVGKSGRVYAVDKNEDHLSAISDLVQADDLENVEIILAKNMDRQVPKGGVDLILMVNVLNLLEKPAEVLSTLGQSLKRGGEMVIIQWSAEKLDPELPDWDKENREQFTLRETLGHIHDANFEITRIETFLPAQNIFFCQPEDRE